MHENHYVYDIEIFRNLFLVVFQRVSDGKFFVFEISPRKDQRHELIAFLKTVDTMIGFNNLRFDYPLLHEFIRLYKNNPNRIGKQLVETLYTKAQKLIASVKGFTWGKKIIPLIKQVDLFLINHYDNFAKATSLKVLEFNLDMQNIQNLPYNHDKVLTEVEIERVVKYCFNDVTATFKFYTENRKSIAFRERMSELYRHDFTNYNDVKIGEEILLTAVANALDIEKFLVRKMRTHRKIMKMTDIILPYIEFESREFKALVGWWEDRVIHKTKGQFTEIPMDEVQPLLPYCNRKTVKSKLKNLNIIYRNFQFDFGTGGLHGICYPGRFKADDEHDVILIDVSSYYPNLASTNRFHPAHIPPDIFKSVVDMLYEQRMNAREVGDMEMVSAIKLALNGALYGKSNSPYSFMYDPQFMMQICVNGQLLLAMLAERCVIAGMQLIQVNTDGVMVRVRKSDREILDNIVKWWTDLTGLKVGYDFFEIVVQRDVNSYIAKYTNGEIKHKGAFDYKYTENGEFHKNYSMLIVAKALEQYFLYGVEPEVMIPRHRNLTDFFKRTKYNSNTRLYYKDGEEEKLLQNTTRYYVANEGYIFTKVMPPLAGKTEDRRFAVESGFQCYPVNWKDDQSMAHMSENVNHNYYIDKVRQIINLIE